VVGWIVARLARLRRPVLFAVVAVLFVIDIAVPDAIPFLDEILLGVGAALLSTWRHKHEPEAPAEAPPPLPPPR
jgi:hypothetical protein